MKYDEVYEYVGQIGIFQVCTCACLLLYCLFALDAISMIFVGADMPHWCRVQQLANFSYDLQKYIAIPTQQEDGEYSACEMYDLGYDNYSTDDYLGWNRTLMNMNETRLVPCSEWIYQQTVFISTIVSRFDLVCQWSYLVPLVSTIYMAGGLIGVAAGGPLSDRFGRKVTLLILLSIKIVGISLSTFSPNYVVFIIGRFFLGAGSMGCYNTCYVLTMELVGPKYRSLMGGSVQVATSICFVFQPLIAYMDRRDVTYQFASMAPNVLILSIALLICESPRWLVVNGRYDEAEALFRKMADINKKQLPADFRAEKIDADESSSGGVMLLFRFPVMRIRTLVCAYTCFASNLLYFSLSLNTGALAGDIYLNTLISASLEVPSIIFCIVLIDWKFLGRRFTTFLTFFTSALSCLLCIPMTLLGIGMGETVLSIVGKSLAVMTYTAMFIASSEVFPTEVRNAGMGLIMVFGGVANMAASFIGKPLAQLWLPLPYVVLGSCGLLAAILCLILPETLGHPLQDTVEQAEKFKGGKIVAVVTEVSQTITEDGYTSLDGSASPNRNTNANGKTTTVNGNTTSVDGLASVPLDRSSVSSSTTRERNKTPHKRKNIFTISSGIDTETSFESIKL